MSRHEYCKTCIDGRECIAYSERSGCDWHNSPEKCKARDDARLKKESAATVVETTVSFLQYGGAECKVA